MVCVASYDYMTMESVVSFFSFAVDCSFYRLASQNYHFWKQAYIIHAKDIHILENRIDIFRASAFTYTIFSKICPIIILYVSRHLP